MDQIADSCIIHSNRKKLMFRTYQPPETNEIDESLLTACNVGIANYIFRFALHGRIELQPAYNYTQLHYESYSNCSENQILYLNQIMRYGHATQILTTRYNILT